MSDNSAFQNTGKQWYVYIIRASDERLYTGITTDVERRFNEHHDPRKGARFFRGRQPEEVVYTERHADRSSALQREAVIKKLSRKLKLELIGRIGD
ncbi:MAG: GIY-YIG nuclease family protein [Lysobacterales bacterium]|jgi:putative endonuclease